MKKTLLLCFLISNYSYSMDLPIESFECTSSATFYENGHQAKVDSQTVASGYVYDDPSSTHVLAPFNFVGLQEFQHTYNDLTIYAYVQTGIGLVHDGSEKVEGSDAYYFTSGSDRQGRKIESSNFEVIQDGLPEKFAMSLNTLNITPRLRADLKVVCNKM
jgi:hypothetical protein